MKDKDSKDKFSELRRRAEVAVEKSLGVSDVSALSPEEVQGLVHELRVHQIELEMQTEELRQTQLLLEASRDNYSKLYDLAPFGYFTLDQNGGILEANLTTSGLLGRAKAFLIGKPLASFVNEEDANALHLHVRQVLETQSKQTCDVRLAKNDGSHIPVRLDSQVIGSQEGSPTVLRTVLTAIISRKHAEEALYDSESRYRRLFESAQDGILILDFDTGKVLDVNQYLIDLLGYSHEAFLEKYLWEVSPFQDTALNKEAFTELQQKGYIRYEDLPLQTGDGRRIDVEFVSNSYLVNGLTFIQCNIRGITERKRAEEALRESETRLSHISSMVSDIAYSCIKQPSGAYSIDWMTGGVEHLTGYSVDDLKSLGCWRSLVVDEDLPVFDHHVIGLAPGTTGSCELRLRHKAGEIVWVSSFAECVVDRESPDSRRLYGGLVDITDRKQAEEALGESEQRYRAVIDNVEIGISLLNPNMEIVEVNKAMKKYFPQVRPGCGQICYEHYNDPPRPEPCLYCPCVLTLQDGEVHEMITQTPSGPETRYYHLVSSPIKDSDGRVQYVIEMTEDITDRKMSEALTQVRMNLLEYSSTHSLDELLQKTLDEVGSLTNSPIGFYDFISEDEKTVFLQGWSTRTVKEFCQAGPKGQHYPIDQAGVWVDAVRERRPVIHNDYSSLPHRRGMPEGHAPVVRELVVPIMRSDRIVAILGIGNKPTDYTEKDVETVSYLADVAWEIVQRKRTEEALNESDKQYRTLFEDSIDGVYSVLRDGTITDANRSFCELFGYVREEMIGKDIRDLYLDPADRQRFQEEIEKTGFVKDYELKFRKSDGTAVDCLLTSSVHFGKDGSIVGYRGILRDLTIRKRLQSQLRQAQKMEAVGTLAGGIAHDFNNLLQVVLGYSELVLSDEDLPGRMKDDLGRVLLAARNGADLVQRLLTFSRQTETKPLYLDLNQRIRQTQKFLERTIPKMINIEIILADDLANIHADPTQIDQVLMNLSVNARDAMPEGGKIILETANIVLDEDYARSHLEAKPGTYVLLRVSDTGSGMDKETVEHIFEPFYTTKGPGAGTGLGLAMVFGIVKQHHGFINCYSEVEHGTTFNVYFPAIERQVELDVEKTAVMPAFGTETILLVDDEEFVRDLGARILSRSGYNVLTATNGREALDLFEKEPTQISLVILDLIMPEMGGKECLKELRKIHPQLKVLIASGLSADPSTKESVEMGSRGFVSKPFRMKELLRQVRKVLDEI